jgi:four helix bundle protein
MAGVNDFTELIAWQLANELRVRALELSRRPSVAGHRRYHSRLTGTAALPPHHIAEGFARERSPEFARRVRIAKASEHELLTLFGEAHVHGFLSANECREYEFLARRAITAASGLIRYLEHSRGRPP